MSTFTVIWKHTVSELKGLLAVHISRNCFLKNFHCGFWHQGQLNRCTISIKLMVLVLGDWPCREKLDALKGFVNFQAGPKYLQCPLDKSSNLRQILHLCVIQKSELPRYTWLRIQDHILPSAFFSQIGMESLWNHGVSIFLNSVYVEMSISWLYLRWMKLFKNFLMAVLQSMEVGWQASWCTGEH